MLNNVLERFSAAQPTADTAAPHDDSAAAEMLAQARQLIAENSFGYARRVLDRLRARSRSA